MEGRIIQTVGGTPPPLFFRTEAPGANRPEGAVDDDPAEDSADGGSAIRCRACGIRITGIEQKISVGTSHRHTFANPHGIVYEIGCFQAAPGCATAGPASDEFTWFSGYRWQIAVCRGCVTHLGWRFASSGGDSFFGLILQRLLEEN